MWQTLVVRPARPGHDGVGVLYVQEKPANMTQKARVSLEAAGTSGGGARARRRAKITRRAKTNVGRSRALSNFPPTLSPPPPPVSVLEPKR